MIKFDIDVDEIKLVARSLDATGEQVGQAISRALSRTAATMRRRAAKALREGLELRRAAAIRRRLRSLRTRRRGNEQIASLWAGLNDLRIGDLKGRPKAYPAGVAFRSTEFHGAFIAKGKGGRRTVFKRVGDRRLPLQEQTFPIKDQADVIIEDEVFWDLPAVFMDHFRRDLAARVNFGIGGRNGRA